MDKTPYIRLDGGAVLQLLDPDPSLIDYRTMVNALAKECRYGNRCKDHYSVAQHSVLCSSLSLQYWPDNYHAAMCALMHDCAEYLLGDIVSTFKNPMCFYDVERDRYVPFEKVEAGVAAAISQALGVPIYDEATTGQLDLVLRCREMLDLTGIEPQTHYPDHMKQAEALPPITGWDWPMAAIKFHSRFLFLSEKLGLDKPRVMLYGSPV